MYESMRRDLWKWLTALYRPGLLTINAAIFMYIHYAWISILLYFFLQVFKLCSLHFNIFIYTRRLYNASMDIALSILYGLAMVEFTFIFTSVHLEWQLYVCPSPCEPTMKVMDKYVKRICRNLWREHIKSKHYTTTCIFEGKCYTHNLHNQYYALSCSHRISYLNEIHRLSQSRVIIFNIFLDIFTIHWSTRIFFV